MFTSRFIKSCFSTTCHSTIKPCSTTSVKHLSARPIPSSARTKRRVILVNHKCYNTEYADIIGLHCLMTGFTLAALLISRYP